MTIDPKEQESDNFLKKLSKEYKIEILKEYNVHIFNQDPVKYKKLGYNKYLEEDEVVVKKILLPTKMIDNINTDLVNFYIDENYKDELSSIIYIKTTLTCYNDMINDICMQDNYLPTDFRCKKTGFIDIPTKFFDFFVGYDEVKLTRLTGKFQVNIKLHSRNHKYFTLLVEGKELESFKNYVLDIIYEDLGFY